MAENAREADERPSHALTSMPERFYCVCGYGMTGPVRTVRGLRTHVTRANSIEAGRRARLAAKSL